MKVFNDLKTCGVADILIAVTDGLKAWSKPSARYSQRRRCRPAWVFAQTLANSPSTPIRCSITRVLHFAIETRLPFQGEHKEGTSGESGAPRSEEPLSLTGRPV